MRIFKKLFGSAKTPHPNTDQPPVHGGDGLSAENPAIVNCASMGVANDLIERFISASCGENWNKEIELTIENPNDASSSLTVISVTKADGSDVNFYFDLTKPVAGTANLVGLRRKP